MTAKELMVFLLVMVFGFLLCLDYLFRKEKIRFENRLLKVLNDRNGREFDRMIESVDAHKYLKPFNRMFLKMNKEVFSENYKKAGSIFDNLVKTGMNSKQKIAVAAQMLPYFAVQRDAARCCICRDLLIGISGYADLKRDADRVCRILKDKNTSDFDDLLREIHEGSCHNRAISEFLVAEICYLRGDKEGVKKYSSMAKQDFRV